MILRKQKLSVDKCETLDRFVSLLSWTLATCGINHCNFCLSNQVGFAESKKQSGDDPLGQFVFVGFSGLFKIYSSGGAFLFNLASKSAAFNRNDVGSKRVVNRQASQVSDSYRQIHQMASTQINNSVFNLKELTVLWLTFSEKACKMHL